MRFIPFPIFITIACLCMRMGIWLPACLLILLGLNACKLDFSPKTEIPPPPNARNTNLDKQISELSSYIKDKPQIAELFFQRARLYDQKKWYAAAVTDAIECIRLSPKHDEAYYLLTLLHYRNNNPKQALQTAQKAEKIGTGQLSFYRALAKIQYEYKDYNNALKNIERVEKFFPEDKEVLYYKGAIFKQYQDTAKAFMYLRAVLAQDPAYKPARLDIIQIFSKLGKLKYANKLTHESLKLFGQDPDFLYELGINLKNLNRFDTSATCFERVVALDSTHWRAAHQGGIYYLNKKYISRAKTLFELAIRHNPKLTSAYYYMGFIHEKYFRDVMLSEGYYAAALKLDPNNQEFEKAQKRMKKRVDFWIFKQSPEYLEFKRRQRNRDDKKNYEREQISDLVPSISDSIR